jgi:hypothetical protein
MGKKNKKNEELKRFSVETTSTFYEVHIVHAKNEEEAKIDCCIGRLQLF